MSPEEWVEATKDAVIRIEEQREVKALAHQNVSINCFHDGWATLVSIEAQVSTSVFHYHNDLNLLHRYES